MLKPENVLSFVYVVSNLLIAFAFIAIFVQLSYLLFLYPSLKRNKTFWLVLLFPIFLCVLLFNNTENAFVNNNLAICILLAVTAIFAWALVFVSFKRLTKIFNLKNSDQILKIIDENNTLIKKELLDSKMSENDFKAAINSSDDIIIIMTKDFKYKFVNDVFGKFTNYNKLNFIGKKPDEVFLQHPHTKLYMTKMVQVAETGQSLVYELTTATSHSINTYFEVKMTPLFDKQGKFDGIISITKDISLLKLNEQKYAKLVADYDELTKMI